MACKACVVDKGETLSILYKLRIQVYQLGKEKIIDPKDIEQKMIKIMNEKCVRCDNEK